jgi:phosphoenolpyruvate---glycerone phosphotransferase subunit DhaL
VNPATDDLRPDFGRLWVEGMLATFAVRADQLGELDRKAGDGDFGKNLTSALKRIRQELDAKPPSTYADWLTAVSRGFLGTGGTSGPLFGMFFRELARCAAEDEPTLAELAQGLAAGLATIQRYGKAEVGHKTMVDALAPAVTALSTDGGLRDAARAAVEGAQSTASIVARRGRASYVGEVSRGVHDPGAVAMALVIVLAADAQDGSSLPADLDWLGAGA